MHETSTDWGMRPSDWHFPQVDMLLTCIIKMLLGYCERIDYQPARSGLLQWGSWSYNQMLKVLPLKHCPLKKKKKKKTRKVTAFTDWNLERPDHAYRS